MFFSTHTHILPLSLPMTYTQENVQKEKKYRCVKRSLNLPDDCAIANKIVAWSYLAGAALNVVMEFRSFFFLSPVSV